MAENAEARGGAKAAGAAEAAGDAGAAGAEERRDAEAAEHKGAKHSTGTERHFTKLFQRNKTAGFSRTWSRGNKMGGAISRRNWSRVAETDGEETQALNWREETQALDSNGARPSIALPLGGGCPGVAPQVPSGLSPPARVRSCCPATTAPGGEGVVALVRALECNSVREGRGDVPNATGNGGTVARATDDWGSPGKRMGGTKRVELARAKNGKEAVVDGGKMAERAAEAEAAEVAEGGSKGQRKSPEQRQRPPRLREGQQGAEEVAGAEAEAAEVAGGGSKGQRKSPEQPGPRQEIKELRLPPPSTS